MARSTPLLLVPPLLLAAPALGQDPAPAPVDEGPALSEPDAGRPPGDPTPAVLRYDWVRFVTGEWLKGSLEVLRDGDLQFESDELGTLKLDWADVVELRSPRVHTVLLQGRRTLVGELYVKGDTVLLTDGTEHRIPRAELLSIVPGEPSEWNYWSGRLSLGATTRKGNTNQTESSAFIEARRETAATRWWTTYNAAFSRAEGVETGNSQRVDSRYDWFLSDRLFVTPASVQYFRDPFQNIRMRLTPAAGFGYDLVADGPLEVSIFGGPAFQYIEFQSTAPGMESSEGSFATIAALNSSWDVTPTVEFGLGYAITVPLPDSTAYNSRLSAVVDVDLIWDLELEVRFVWDRVNDPQPDDTGNVPFQDDYRTTVGLSWEF